MDDCILLDKVSFAYEAPETVLFDVSLCIKQGEFVAVLGHNGSGKSTLAKLLNAILVPTAGKVTVFGLDTADDNNINQIRRSAGMVFQNPDNQIVATSVEEDTAFALENLGVEPDEMRRRVDAALAAVGIAELADRPPHKLSGGQKQRVAIAGILAMQPRCIILDEPTAMLDPRGRREVISTIKRLHGEGITVILVTHYMDEAVQAGRVVVMDRGRIALDGTPGEVFARADKLRSFGLDVPASNQLLRALAADGVAVDTAALTPETAAAALEKTFAQHGGVAAVDTAELFPRTGTPQSDVILRTERLSHVFSPDTPFRTTALDGVTADIYAGEFLGVIGHTGSGKSTLMQHLNGLLKPTAGTVFFNNEDIHAKGYRLPALRFKVGMVFQYPEYQLFEETVRKDIGFGPKNMGLSPEEIEQRVLRAARFCGLREELLERSPFELSGGQKRRAAIAGVIAMEPQVLILDEPAAGLDPAGREKILGQIDSYHCETGSTVVLVSHSMEDIARYCTRVLAMQDGRVLLCAPTREVFGEAELLVQSGLDLPEITRVLMLLRRDGFLVPTEAYTVSEAETVLLRLLRGGAARA